MLENIAVRIRALRIKLYGDKRGAYARFGRDTGVDATMLRRYEEGLVEPGASKIEAIVKGTPCSAHWLLTGEGKMLNGNHLRVAEEQAEYAKGAYPMMAPKDFMVARLEGMLEFIKSNCPKDMCTNPKKKGKTG